MKFILMFAMLFMSSFARADDIDIKFNELLSPSVRVTFHGGGGSGTVIYSEDREKKGEYQTFVLTNHHVVARAIHIEQKWDNLRQRYYKAENNENVDVEIFVYQNGKVVSSNKIQGEILAHNENEDIAVLKLIYPLQIKAVAKLFPLDKTLRVFQEVYAVGSSLLHNPIPSRGEISSLGDLIDNRSYIMSTAPIIFGNSGGSMFTFVDGTWYLIGMPARVAVSSSSPISHMNWFVPIERIREFATLQKLDFLLEIKKTPTECFEERKKLRKISNEGQSNEGNSGQKNEEHDHEEY